MTSSSSPTLLVLAAGMGSRYGGLKQIDPVGPAGETIIDYSIFDALRAGFGKLVFVIRKDIEERSARPSARALKSALRSNTFSSRSKTFRRGSPCPPDAPSRGAPRRPFCWLPTQSTSHSPPSTPTIFTARRLSRARRAPHLRLARLRDGRLRAAQHALRIRHRWRAACARFRRWLPEHIVEMTKIERDGNGARNTDAAGTVTKLTGDEPVSMNYVGIHSARLRSVA